MASDDHGPVGRRHNGHLHRPSPSGAGPFPAMVVAHHRDGVDDFTRRSCDAAGGDRVRRGRAQSLSSSPRRTRIAASRASILEDGQTIANVNATVDHLQSLETVRACDGHDRPLHGRANVVPVRDRHSDLQRRGRLYGGGIMAERATSAPRRSRSRATSNARSRDSSARRTRTPRPRTWRISLRSARASKSATSSGSYDGAGHAFQNFSAKTYREQQSEDAWGRLVPLLKAELKG